MNYNDKYLDLPDVIALSSEYRILQKRQDEIFDELQRKFPVDSDHTWGGCRSEKYPLFVWRLVEDDV